MSLDDTGLDDALMDLFRVVTHYIHCDKETLLPYQGRGQCCEATAHASSVWQISLQPLYMATQ